jgi:ABC-type transport system involved in multi-copper enzyme maturation permease subunit
LKTLIVARYSFVEIVKSNVLINTLFLGLGLVVIIYIASEFTYGVPHRIALDFGLGAVSLSSVGMATFFGVGLISKEIENRTVYMVLSKPLSRQAFIVGRIIGMGGILFINISIIGVITTCFFSFLGGEINTLVITTFLFIFLEAMMALGIIVFFSLITNNTLSIIFTIFFYIVGHALGETKALSFAVSRPLLQSFLKFIEFILPNFSKINLRTYVLYEQSLPDSFLIQAFLYAVFYSFFLFLVSTLIFNRKNLD